MTDKIKILESIALAIEKQNGQMFYVGGYVRDLILGRKNKDIDVEIHGIAVKDALTILESFGAVDEIGASFGVLKIKSLDIDFTFPRHESKSGDKHTDFDINIDPYMGLHAAAKRRDFTMNAIMQNVITKEIIDPFNGLFDMNCELIRLIDPDTFVDDALRPLRAAQFAARFGFDIDPEIIKIAQTIDYSHLSKERIFEEINKALLAPTPSIAFKYLYDMGILQQILPEVAILSTIDQDPIHHPEGDVFNHTMMVLDEGAKLKDRVHEPLFFMWSCLLHDIGKAKDHFIDDDGHIRNNGHDITGAKMVRPTLNRLTTNKKLMSYVEKMTRYHMRMHILLTMSDIKIKRIMLDSDMHDLLFLNKADTYGRQTSPEKKESALMFDQKVTRINNLSNDGFGKITPIIQGKDLIRLGLEPGPEFKSILEHVFDLQLQDKPKFELERYLHKKYVSKTSSSITNTDLIKLGYTPGPAFKYLIQKAFELEQQGYTKKEILQALQPE